jgi:hypothetical protein
LGECTYSGGAAGGGGGGFGDDGSMRFGPEHNSAVINLGLSEQAVHGNATGQGTSVSPAVSNRASTSADGGLWTLEYMSKSTLPAVRKHLDELCASGADISAADARDESIGCISRALLHIVKHLVSCGNGAGKQASKET